MPNPEAPSGRREGTGVSMTVLRLTGTTVCGGIARGTVFHYVPFVPAVEGGRISHQAVPEALDRYLTAREAARAELDAVRRRLASGAPEKAKIFAAHQEILTDDAMDEDIRGAIEEELLPPSGAVSAVYDRYAALIGRTRDPLIRERTADMADVKKRLLRCLQGLPDRDLSTLNGDVILVARELLPSDTASLDPCHVRGIVTETGGATSHTAILARSYGIPALLGVEGAMELLTAGVPVLLDTGEKEAVLSPTPAQQACFAEKQRLLEAEAAELRQYLGEESRMADGTPVSVCLNLSGGEPPLEEGVRVDGVGLFRTEFLYMGRDTLPTEEEQTSVYRQILARFPGQSVTIRTLDIGGDKKSDCLRLPTEDNPFLGNRALRLCFSRPEVFSAQLRACLRSGIEGKLKLMFPMVGSLEDLRRAKVFVEEAKAELRTRNIPHSEDVRLGIMVEIPSIALIADLAAVEADFCSIGTNDLTQYVLAADRMNPAVEAYYQSFHPGVLRLIGYVADQFRRRGKEVCVCGEMAADPCAAALLLGLGVNQLSMSLSAVPGVRRMIRGLTMARARTLAQAALKLSTAGEVEAFARRELADILRQPPVSAG